MPCLSSSAETASAVARLGYGPSRTTKGEARVTVAFRGEPIERRACDASVRLAYGPAVTVDCVAEFAVTTKDVPRVMVLRTTSSASTVDRSRRRSHPAVTP